MQPHPGVLITTTGEATSKGFTVTATGSGWMLTWVLTSTTPSTYAKHCDVELPGPPGPPAGFAEDPSPVKPSSGGDSARACKRFCSNALEPRPRARYRVGYRSTGSVPILVGPMVPVRAPHHGCVPLSWLLTVDRQSH